MRVFFDNEKEIWQGICDCSETSKLPSMTDPLGYRPNDVRIKELMAGGQALAAWRAGRFSHDADDDGFDDGSEVEQTTVPIYSDKVGFLQGFRDRIRAKLQKMRENSSGSSASEPPKATAKESDEPQANPTKPEPIGSVVNQVKE